MEKQVEDSANLLAATLLIGMILVVALSFSSPRAFYSVDLMPGEDNEAEPIGEGFSIGDSVQVVVIRGEQQEAGPQDPMTDFNQKPTRILMQVPQ
jgi:hypothetical protein